MTTRFGTIKVFFGDRGFGFIEQEEGGKDIFFHISDSQKLGHEPREHERVAYEVTMGPKGPRAVDVRPPVAHAKGYRFLNPYNFARSPGPPQSLRGDASTDLMGRCPPPPHDRWVGLNGTITCKVEAVTPLFISDSKSEYASDDDAQEDHKTYRFFHFDFGKGPEPALPASSLRGMVRTVFEAATNSCYAHFDYDKRLSYHLPAAEALKLTPARVEKDKQGRWHLRLLPGSARLAVGERPRDKIYAARVERYEALVPGRRRKRGPQRNVRFREVPLNGLKHKDECFALADELQFPPVWNVVRIARTREELVRHQKPGQKILRGYLCLNNQNIESKRFERFFFRVNGSSAGPEYVPLPTEVRNKYSELIGDYQDRHKETIARWKRKGKQPDRPWIERNGQGRIVKKEAAFSRFVIGGPHHVQEGDLVYAMLVGTVQAPRVSFIVPVAVPRVGYERRTAHLLPRHLWKCTEYEDLCPACRTFGWVYGHGPGKEELEQGKVTAFAGRVHFEHGRPKPGYEAFQPITLSILSTPKPTTTRFYLKPVDGKPRPGQDDFRAGYDNRDNVLRGRKVFRHQGHTGDVTYWMGAGREYKLDARSDQNRTVQDALKPGAEFEFPIHFENLAEAELGALLWSLQMDGQQFHRLGLAKPLGFGSVQMTECQVSLMDPRQRYGSAGSDGLRQATAEEHREYIQRFKEAMKRAYQKDFGMLEHIQDLLALLGEPDPELPIHYPRPTAQPSPEGKNFEWFMGNSRNKSARYVLEMPGDEEGLPLIDKRGKVQN